MTTVSRQSRSGFTLIELVLYFGVASLLFVSITSIFLLLVQGQVKQQSIAEVEQQAAFVMEYMTQAIQNADSITTPSAGSSGSGLQLVAVNPGDDPVIFQESSGVLQVSIGGAAYENLTSDTVTLSSLYFTTVSPSSTSEVVQIQFTLERTNSADRQEYEYSKTYQTSVSVRN